MSDYFDEQLRTPPEADDSAPLAEDESPGATESTTEEAAAPGTSGPIKVAAQELLKYGLVEQAAKPNIYRELRQNPTELQRILEPFDLVMELDDVRGIAFLAVPTVEEADRDDPWQHPLVRRQRLTTDQSLLVAILRQNFVAYEQTHGIGASDARIDLEELQAQFDVYLGDSGSDKSDAERLRRVITQLAAHGVVSEPDKENQVTIRPIIVHLANPEHLAILLAHFRDLAEKAKRADTGEESETEEGA
ncbi:DUF4194 domain-containing protein [Cerasicoccus frondis]|uniref:DUF4194 domain-containing protein n=1 Tax=Cerasicoccus frondis TaxID=490090 RepID=UPI0028526A2E|nr:DUF4194 domain-containing protein [Cerasicoccus frondis]